MQIILDIKQKTSRRIVEVKPRIKHDIKDTVAEHNLGEKIYQNLMEKFQSGKYERNYEMEYQEKNLNAKIQNDKKNILVSYGSLFNNQL